MLSKYLKQEKLVFPRIRKNLDPNEGQSNRLCLKSALGCRRDELHNKENLDVYMFIDPVTREAKGKVEQFIWNVWEATDLPEDDLNYIVMEEKLINEKIPTKLSPECLEHLVYFLYNGTFRDDISYEVLLELDGAVGSLNMKEILVTTVRNAMRQATSLANLRQAWGSGKGQASFTATSPVLIDRTVSYIICHPEQVFASKEAWNDIPEQVLKMLLPKSLYDKLEEYKEQGATLEKRKVYRKGEKCFLQVSHFKLVYFLLEWAKKKFMVDQKDDVYEEPNLHDFRQTLGKFVDLLDSDNFDLTKYTRDSAIVDGKTLIAYLGVYVHLKNVTKDTVFEQKQVEELALPPPVWLREESDDEGDSQPLSKRSRTELSGASNASGSPTPLAIEGGDSTSTLELIKDLFGKTRLTDTGVYFEGKLWEVRLHSYVLQLRQSAFSDYFADINGESHIFDFGDCCCETISNFFKSFYMTKYELKNANFLSVEYCFLALLFQVEFLLESAFIFTGSVPGCMESLVMQFISAVRMGRRNQGNFGSKKVQNLKAEIQRKLPDAIKTVSFRYLVDEEIVDDLIKDYKPSHHGFYFDMISSLESTSKTLQWLRKEGEDMHVQRMRNWKANGVIKLDKVSKDQLKDLARRGLLDVVDAIEYSYAIGCNSTRRTYLN